MSSSRISLRRSITALSLMLVGCAGPGLDVDEVLIDDFAPEDQATTILMPLAAFDISANATRERAEQSGATVDELNAASRSLFYAADARVQIAALEALEARPDASLAQIVEVDALCSERIRAEVESLTRAGRQYAERALELDAADPEALLRHGMNSTLLAWSVGTRRAILDGLGPACERSTRAALEADEALHAAAPLRLRGRFLSKAPWPVGDEEAGLRLLHRAVELAPVQLNWLFLGDALFTAGDTAAAVDAWQRAEEAEPDEDSIALAGYHLLLTRGRLAAAADD